MKLTHKPSAMRPLPRASLAVVVLLGFLTIENGHSTSQHHKPQDNSDTSPALRTRPLQLAAWYPADKPFANVEANQQAASGQKLLSQVRGSLRESVSSMKIEEPVCEFNKAEGLPRRVLRKKFVECYKKMSAKNEQINYQYLQSTLKSNRRVLRGGTTVTSSKVHEKRSEVIETSQDKKIEAAFHIDYNGPKTHPPKNN